MPKIIPEQTKGEIPLHTDIGLDILLEKLHEYIPDSKISNGRTSHSRVKEAIDSWILGFETNPSIVAERQELVSYFLENPEFVEAVGNLMIHPQPSGGDRYDRFNEYAGMSRRFDTFAESVSAVRKLLEGKNTPKSLTELLHSCEEAETAIQELRSHLNPDFELRVDGSGRYDESDMRYRSGVVKGRYDFDYIVVNKNNNSVIRGDANNVEHDLELGYSLMNHSRDFLKELEQTIEHTLKSKITKNPFVKKAYAINGSVRYNPETGTMNCEFHFVRDDKKEKGSFAVSLDHNTTPKSIIEAATFAHNYQVISVFDPVIMDFEDTIVELKALSAATHFLRNLGDKGFPSTFPDIIQGDSNADLYIRNMFHPLLAYFSKNGEVVPNDVETTRDSNVRMITGSNNNGKTCYIDGIGLSQAMYQAGMPIIAEEARVRLKDKILTHYIRRGDIKAGQSRHGSESARAFELISGVSSDNLILCDELFTGTAPQDGEDASKLVLDSLIRTGATLFFTTHYHELGNHFRESPHVVQLCSKLDHSTNPPSYTYKIQPGISKESDGLVVAAQYGVSKANLDTLLAQKEMKGDFKLR